MVSSSEPDESTMNEEHSWIMIDIITLYLILLLL